jgi:hypothetical protein
MPIRQRTKTIAGTISGELAQKIRLILPKGMTISSFVAASVIAMVNSLESGEKIPDETIELLSLRNENQYLKQLIRDSYERAGLQCKKQ